MSIVFFFFFFQAEDGIRDVAVTGVQTCALPIYVELGYGLRRNRGRLDYDQMESLVSTRLGSSNRIGLLYQPTFFRTQQQDFHSNYFAVMLDSEPWEKLNTHAEIDGEEYFGAPAQADGTLDLRYRVRPS